MRIPALILLVLVVLYVANAIQDESSIQYWNEMKYYWNKS